MSTIKYRLSKTVTKKKLKWSTWTNCIQHNFMTGSVKISTQKLDNEDALNVLHYHLWSDTIILQSAAALENGDHHKSMAHVVLEKNFTFTSFLLWGKWQHFTGVFHEQTKCISHTTSTWIRVWKWEVANVHLLQRKTELDSWHHIPNKLLYNKHISILQNITVNQTSSSAIAERPYDARHCTSYFDSQNWEVELFSHPFGRLRGNVDASSVRRWKKRGRLPIADNWTL